MHLPMLALEPRCFRVLRPSLRRIEVAPLASFTSHVRLTLRQTVHATSPTSWVGSRAWSPSSFDDVFLARESSADGGRLEVLSPCDELTSLRVIVQRGHLAVRSTFWAELHLAMRSSFEDPTRDERHPLWANSFHLAAITIHRELDLSILELTSPCSHLGMSSRRDQLTLR